MACFYGRGSAAAAERCSGSASTAIAGIAIAVENAARRRGFNNGGGPTAGTNVARKAGSTIATGNGSTGANWLG